MELQSGKCQVLANSKLVLGKGGANSAGPGGSRGPSHEAAGCRGGASSNRQLSGPRRPSRCAQRGLRVPIHVQWCWRRARGVGWGGQGGGGVFAAADAGSAHLLTS